MSENQRAEGQEIVDEVLEHEDELETAQKKAEQNWNLFLRARADLENYRKNVERDRSSSIRRGKRDLFLRLLEIKDNFDRALDTENAGVPDQFLKGVTMIADQFDRLLKQEGIEQIAAVGCEFDPAFHEAVAVWESPDVTKDTCTDELLKGFTYEGELLRAARVRVGRPVQ